MPCLSDDLHLAHVLLTMGPSFPEASCEGLTQRFGMKHCITGAQGVVSTRKPGIPEDFQRPWLDCVTNRYPSRLRSDGLMVPMAPWGIVYWPIMYLDIVER